MISFEIRSSYIALGLILLPLFYAQDSIRQGIDNQAIVRQERQAERNYTNQLAREAEQNAALSRVAIARVKGRCTPLYVKDTSQPTSLSDGYQVIDSGTRKPVLSGFGCTQLGDTCNIVGGFCRDIAGVAPEDMDEYQELFKRQL